MTRQQAIDAAVREFPDVIRQVKSRYKCNIYPAVNELQYHRICAEFRRLMGFS